MVIGLEGILENKTPTQLAINVQGIIYSVFVSVCTCNQITEKKGEKIRLHITEIIREDARLFFGFKQEIEQELFVRLLKINGVGPKVAMAILSVYEPSVFMQVIESKDLRAIQRVPGIGPKSAGRILVELAGYSLELSKTHAEQESGNSYQVRLALESLGFKSSEIDYALEGLQMGEVSDMIKNALKKIQQK